MSTRSGSPPRTPTWSSSSNDPRLTPHSTPTYYPPSQGNSPRHKVVHVVESSQPSSSSSHGAGSGGAGAGAGSVSTSSTPASRYGEFEAYASHDDSSSPMLRPSSPLPSTSTSFPGSAPGPPRSQSPAPLPLPAASSSSSARKAAFRRSSISAPKPRPAASGSSSSTLFSRRKCWLIASLLTITTLYCFSASSPSGPFQVGKRVETAAQWRPFDRWKGASSSSSASANPSSTTSSSSSSSSNEKEASAEGDEPPPQRQPHEWWRPEPIYDDEGNLWTKLGGNGSTVRTETGETFVYRNDFGGTWDARTDSLEARCQDDTPPLSEKWDYSKRTISGVNFGGWLTPEPFITPHIYEPYLAFEQEAVDEYTLSVHLGDRLESVLTHHYETFITEKDFAEVAGAGLNWVRIPLSYWAIETVEGEPFLAHVSWKYFLKAIEWARKYGLRVNLDLHTVPGSANGWNHSGKSGTVNLLNGVMGIANAERTLNIVRALSKFVSLPVNKNIIPMFSVLNEPYLNVIGHAALRPFYLKLYDTVRAESGFGDGNGPVIVLHDGFKGTAVWHHFMKGADRVALDSHRYLCFRTPNTDPLPVQSLKPCVNWMRHFNRTMRSFGISMVAEWSIATNDCGRFVNGVHVGTRFEGTYGDPRIKPAAEIGACEFWEDATRWDDQMKLDLQDIALAHMDAFQNWFYWTWKTGPSVLHPDRPANPMWSYRHGLINGYIPRNPRRFPGFCRKQFDRFNRTQEKMFHFSGQLLDWQAGLGENPGSELDRGGFTWPPDKIGLGTLEGQELNVKELPRWSKTGKAGPLTFPKGRYEGLDDENEDEEAWYEPFEGCEYLDAYSGVGPDVSIPDPVKCQPPKKKKKKKNYGRPL